MNKWDKQSLIGWLLWSTCLLWLLVACGDNQGNGESIATPTKLTEAQIAAAPTLTPTAVVTDPPGPTNTPEPSGCHNDLTFITDVTIPDNTVFTAGEPFTKTWRVQNSGTCTWTAAYEWVFAEGGQLGAAAVNPLNTSVAPGEEHDISLRMTAPNTPGTHLSRWQLRTDEGAYFGARPWVLIEVVDNSDTNTNDPNADNNTLASLKQQLFVGSNITLHQLYCIPPDNGAATPLPTDANPTPIFIDPMFLKPTDRLVPGFEFFEETFSPEVTSGTVLDNSLTESSDILDFSMINPDAIPANPTAELRLDSLTLEEFHEPAIVEEMLNFQIFTPQITIAPTDNRLTQGGKYAQLCIWHPPQEPSVVVDITTAVGTTYSQTYVIDEYSRQISQLSIPLNIALNAPLGTWRVIVKNSAGTPLAQSEFVVEPITQPVFEVTLQDTVDPHQMSNCGEDFSAPNSPVILKGAGFSPNTVIPIGFYYVDMLELFLADGVSVTTNERGRFNMPYNIPPHFSGHYTVIAVTDPEKMSYNSTFDSNISCVNVREAL